MPLAVDVVQNYGIVFINFTPTQECMGVYVLTGSQVTVRCFM